MNRRTRKMYITEFKFMLPYDTWGTPRYHVLGTGWAHARMVSIAAPAAPGSGVVLLGTSSTVQLLGSAVLVR